jgi:DNA-binding FrmR family transcriptional regulator
MAEKRIANDAVEDAAAGQDGDVACCGSPVHKATPRSPELQRDLQTRLNRIIGQLNGIKSMIDDNRYCGDVLVQLAAVQSALKGVSTKVLQDHMETCVVERVQHGDVEVIDELMKLWRKFT